MQNDEALERFERLVTAYQPVVYRAAYLILRDRSEAEDVAQETFVRAYGAMQRTDPGEGVRAWLYRIAVNTALNEVRRRKRQSAAYTRALDVDRTDLIDTETRSVVADAIERLPDRLRVAVICRYYLDLSEKETAKALGIRTGTVKSRLHLARKALGTDLVEVDV